MFAVVALIVFASTVPVTLKFVRPVRLLMFALVMLAFVAVNAVTFARLLMLFCALALKVPLKVPPVIVPVALMSVKLPVVALTVAACTVPVTLKFVRPVRFVMFAFVAVSVPLTVALLIFAVVILSFVAVKLVRFARLVILFKVP